MTDLDRRRLLLLPAAAAVAASSTAVAAEEKNASDDMVADHVLVNVTDFEKSLRWYCENLGFEEIVRWTVEGLADMHLAYLERGSFRIELASGPETGKTASLPVAKDFAEHFAHRGITHLCFRVRDVDDTLSRLAERGVPTFSPAIDFPPLKCRVGFVQDPDGNVIEFKGPMAGRDVVNGKATWKETSR